MLWRRKREEDLERELRSHLEAEAEDQGDPHAARRALGNLGRVKEDVRDAWGWMWLERLAQDLRYALRTMRQSPGFTLATILCLALGIGANTAMFSLIDAVLLRSLPVEKPERLVTVTLTGSNFSYPQFVYLRDHVHTIGVFAHSDLALNLNSGPLTDTPSAEVVSDNYFAVLGVQPSLGRLLASGDETTAVISHRYWRTRFGADPGIVGRTVRLNGLAFTVIGVTPSPFFGVEVGKSTDVFVPLSMRDRLSPGEPSLPKSNSFWLDVMGRLQPQVAIDQARSEAEVYYQQSSSDQALGPGTNPRLVQFLRSRHITMASADKGVSRLRAQFRQPLQILMAVVVLVLLIACANVASLLLARGTTRRKEMAVRLALGAGRARLLRQLLTESMVLTGAGGLLGLLLASWGAAALVGFLDKTVLDVSPDGPVLGFALAVSVVTGLLFGAVPSAQAARQDLNSGLKDQASPQGRRLDLRNFLVAGQVGISLLLVLGAGLFLRTLVNLKNLDSGLHADNVVLVSLNPGLSRYSPERTRSFYDDLLKRVTALPGVVSATTANGALLAGSAYLGVTVEGHTQSSATVSTALKNVAPRFFETMGIALRLGRDFLPGDRAGSPGVAIVNETFVRQLFPGENPIGKHIGLNGKADLEVIGVISDTKYRDLRAAVPVTVYTPIDQEPEQRPWFFARTLHVRTSLDAASTYAAIREQIRALDKDLPAGPLSTFTEVVDAQLVRERLIAILASFFGIIALLLASIGLYGVVAYSVQRRTREIGIRMALGARRGVVIRMVLRHSLVLIGVGLAIGLPLSLWLSKLTASLLFGVTPGDPLTIGSAMLVLVAVAALAGYLPARRASRIDPMTALRHE